jgi:hypothetical protein
VRVKSESLNTKFKNGEINSKQLLAGLSLLVGGPKKEDEHMFGSPVLLLFF